MITTRDKILSAVMKPTRYTGGELNSVIKNPADVDVRFGFCFADTYEIAMSHLGLKILYHTLNDREDTYCERVFAPWTDMEEEMKKHGMKLFALETGDEITHFDMLGFTLQYELSYSNIVNMLMLADIPVRAKTETRAILLFAAAVLVRITQNLWRIYLISLCSARVKIRYMRLLKSMLSGKRAVRKINVIILKQ